MSRKYHRFHFFKYLSMISLFTILLVSNGVFVYAAGDGSAPILESIEAGPKEVKVGDTVTIKARIKDEGSGVKSALVVYQNPSDNRYQNITLHYDSSQNVWLGTYVVRSTDEEGIWSVDHVTLLDNAGNIGGVYNLLPDTNFTVVNPAGDGSAPILESIEAGPKEVKVGDTVTIKARIKDEGSGVKSALVVYQNPSDNRYQDITLHYDSSQNVWLGTYVVRSTDEEGIWSVDHVTLWDNAGNIGGVYNPLPDANFTVVQEGEISTTVENRVEENDPSIIYTGNWKTVEQAGNSGGLLKTSTSKGASAELTFTGTGVKLISKKHKDRGLADVYIDGRFDTTIDMSSSTTEFQAQVYEKSGLSNGEHTIKIVVKGIQAAGSVSGMIALDSFIIIQEEKAPTTVENRVEENDPSIIYTGNWKTVEQAGNSGGLLKTSASKGASAELTFTGTGVKLISKKHKDRGLADVYIDGEFDMTIDMSSSTTEFQAQVYEKSGLSNGEHTIKVVVKGIQAAGSVSGMVALDSFIVLK